ncbi:MAG: Sir2 family NAD-dependent protein deacetylase [Nitriliruptoraceae bacterium]
MNGERYELDPAAVHTVAARLQAADVVVALTGAGVSTASGIPDFRGPEGLWTREPEAQRFATIDAYVGDTEVRREAWRRRADELSRQVEPNAAHHALADLERLERLTTLVTQNVDGLHQEAGSSPGRVIEIHGSVRDAICLTCGRRQPMGPVLGRVRAGEDDPRCEDCGGILKSATVSFGQSLDPALLQRAHDATMGADVFLAVGTSLLVHPVALLPRTALEAGATLILINAETTPYDDRADVLLRADAGTALRRIVEELRAIM